MNLLKKKGLAPIAIFMAACLAVGGVVAYTFWSSGIFSHTITVITPADISVLCSFDPESIPHDPTFQWFVDNEISTFSPDILGSQLNLMLYDSYNFNELSVGVDLSGNYFPMGGPVVMDVFMVYRNAEGAEVATLIDQVSGYESMPVVNIPGFEALYDQDFDPVGGTHQNYLKLVFDFNESSLQNGHIGENSYTVNAVIRLGDSDV